MLNNIKLLKRLENIAWENLSRESRCFHVAFIFRGNNILSVGTNSNKTHPKIKQYGYEDHSRLHAELSACIKLGEEDCRKYSIGVLRIDRDDLVTMLLHILRSEIRRPEPIRRQPDHGDRMAVFKNAAQLRNRAHGVVGSVERG